MTVTNSRNNFARFLTAKYGVNAQLAYLKKVKMLKHCTHVNLPALLIWCKTKGIVREQLFSGSFRCQEGALISMEVTTSGRAIFVKLTALVERLVDSRQNAISSPRFDPMHEEICRIEQALANLSTRPSRVIRKPELSEPLTEQQKIIDLAGWTYISINKKSHLW